MKLKTGIGQQHPGSMQPYFNCGVTKTLFVQDTHHIGTKIRNKFLAASVLLPMGDKQATVSHLKILLNKVPKDVHGLVMKDICPDDRQNYESLRKVMQPRVLEALNEHVPDSEATVMYLKLCQNVTSAFLDPTLTPLERLNRMWFSIFFLRIWRNWLSTFAQKNTKSREEKIKRKQKENDDNSGSDSRNKYHEAENCITENAYTCIELNGHSLIQLIMKFRDEGRPELFIPMLLSSQQCEATFRMLRSMTSIYWTKINMTLAEVFHKIGRIQLQNDIRYFKIPEVKLPRTNDLLPKMVLLELPSNDEIFATIDEARNTALTEAAKFGMNASSIENLVCKLSEPKPIISKRFDLCKTVEALQLQEPSKSPIIDSTANNPILVRSELKLRDYSDANVVLNNRGAFAQVKDNLGNVKTVRKSSVLWLLTTTKNSLSSARLLRVRGQEIERANKRYLSAENSDDIVAESAERHDLWQAEELKIGDWCFFIHHAKKGLNISIDKILANVRVGMVVAFKYVAGKNAREKQYTWDNAPVHTDLNVEKRRGVDVLATWYLYSENGTLDRLNEEKKHYFINIENYVGTTEAITRAANGKFKIDLDSIALCYFNQQLINFLGNSFEIDSNGIE